MEIVVGTYEEIILGYKLEKSQFGHELKSTFSDHTHTGCVKTVAISSHGFLAAGSSDERISLFNLKRKKEIGTLMHHDGSLTCLAFYDKRHMFSASEDGTIGIWQTGNWECLRTLRGHKEAVYGIAVHPSGKLLLSVGKDKTLRTWNLITGRQAYVTNIKQAADLVCWCPSGEVYAIVFNNKIDLYKVETTELFHTIKCSCRVQTVAFLKPGIVVIGQDGGNVEIVDTNTKQSLLQFSTDTIRVKAMRCCQSPSQPDKHWLTTGSSDGFIKVWELSESDGTWAFENVAEIDTKFRIISLALLPEHISSPKETKLEVKEETPTAVEPSEEVNEEDKPPKKKKKKVKNIEAAKETQEDSQEDSQEETKISADSRKKSSPSNTEKKLKKKKKTPSQRKKNSH